MKRNICGIRGKQIKSVQHTQKEFWKDVSVEMKLKTCICYRH